MYIFLDVDVFFGFDESVYPIKICHQAHPVEPVIDHQYQQDQKEIA